MASERSAQRLGADVGIAVHVPADPGAKSQNRTGGHFDLVRLVYRLLQLLGERRDDAVDDVRQIEDHVLELVHHCGTRGGVRIGLPRGSDFLANPRQCGALFIGRARRIQPLHQQAADHLLLFEQRAPRRFGGVRGEHGLDPQPLEEGGDLGRRDAGGSEPKGRALETAFLRIARVAQVVAPAADAVNPFGEIDDLEVGGERADQRFGIARRQRAHQRVQLVVGPGDRGVPDALHELEERLTTLLA